MTTGRRQIATLAVFGAVTAGGGAAVVAADQSSSKPAPPAQVPAASDALTARTTALHEQVRSLLHEDKTLHAALHDARRHLAMKVHHNERIIARQRASLARTTAATISSAPAAPAPAPAPAPASAAPQAPPAAVSPAPTASHHGTTGASGGGSGHHGTQTGSHHGTTGASGGGGGDDGHEGGGHDD